MRPALEVADIFRHHGAAYRAEQAACLSNGQRRVMAAIEACRTAALGGHVEECEDCGETRVAYNSCRNRHCPKCQGLARAQWLADRQSELLPVPYFHVVFTVPAAIAAIALQNKAIVYDILFKAAAKAVRTIAADPKHLGAEVGMIAVLHTWGSAMTHHPHVHMIVPGGGLSPAGCWIACRPGFFLSVRVLSRLYRRLFLARLMDAFDRGTLCFFGDLAQLAERVAFAEYLRPLRRIEWVVYSKRPFANPQHVLDYLGRYTHRVAITNTRLVEFDDGQVRFRWKDYRRPEQPKVMTLTAHEFIRRFLLHVVPAGFRRIRHFGFLANTHRNAKLATIRAALDVPAPIAREEPADYRARFALLTGRSPDTCPCCGGHMVDIATLPRAPTASGPIWCDSS